MHQIWTNPSLERSVTNSSLTQVSENSYLTFVFKNPMSNDPQYDRSIDVSVGKEYRFTYYDPNMAVVQTVTGRVEGLAASYISIKYQTDCSDKYDGCLSATIPIQNIMLITNTDGTCENESGTNSKEGYWAMLLGIQADIIRSLVINLGLIDDCPNKAVTYVELKIGQSYNVWYECEYGRIHKIIGTLVQFEEVGETDCCTGKGYVRQCVGCGDSVYIGCDSKEKYMCSKPVDKIKLTFDTSADGSGVYQVIMLSQVRNVELIESEDIPSEEEDPMPLPKPCCAGCPMWHEGCDPTTCPKCDPFKGCDPVFEIGDRMIGICENTVVIRDAEGNITMTCLEDVFDDYFDHVDNCPQEEPEEEMTPEKAKKETVEIADEVIKALDPDLSYDEGSSEEEKIYNAVQEIYKSYLGDYKSDFTEEDTDFLEKSLTMLKEVYNAIEGSDFEEDPAKDITVNILDCINAINTAMVGE